jgi:transposase-like protein
MEAGAGNGQKSPLGPAVQIDDGRSRRIWTKVVGATVEEILNALSDAEADHLCGARKYERAEGRKNTRAGSNDRYL